MYILIAAMTNNRVIGSQGTLPWHYPEDLRHFRETTRGHCVVMGSKTFDSIGKPLPQRTNIVLSRTPRTIDGVIRASSIDEIHQQTKHLHDENNPVFIIGGATLYTQFLDQAKKIILTRIPDHIDGDTFFPKFEDTFVMKKKTVIGNVVVEEYERGHIAQYYQ